MATKSDNPSPSKFFFPPIFPKLLPQFARINFLLDILSDQFLTKKRIKDGKSRAKKNPLLRSLSRNQARLKMDPLPFRRGERYSSRRLMARTGFNALSNSFHLCWNNTRCRNKNTIPPLPPPPPLTETFNERSTSWLHSYTIVHKKRKWAGRQWTTFPRNERGPKETEGW